MKKVNCNCSACPCPIKLPREKLNFGGLCALCRNDIHASLKTHNKLNKIEKIERIIDKWHEERYDTDWDFLQGSLMRIRKIVKK